MGESLDYLKTFALFPIGLRRFAQQRMTLDRARQIVRERMEHREENLLRLVEKSIYGHPTSPYLALLKHAGCELGDLRRMVKDKGLEGALRELREEGVYVTYEELKGRKPIARNGLNLLVSARDFDNPNVRHEMNLRTGGSTGLAIYVGAAFDQIAGAAVNSLLLSSAFGVLGAPAAVWSPSLPGPGLVTVLLLIHQGRQSRRWFLPQGWRNSKYWFKYGLATWYMVLWCRALGLRVPWPQVVQLDQASAIARWMAGTLEQNERCVLSASASLAVRVCVVAEQEHLRLDGAVFSTSGESVTAAKARAIERVGARVLNTYGMTEAGLVGLGCASSDDPGDMHLTKDSLALITFPYAVENLGITVDSFNLTSLLDISPKILLNVQSDDYGVVEDRACGCELESYGLTTHLREVRSYGKLVGEGVTLIGNEMLRILEQVLPTRFGGTAQDYQLVEQEDDRGFTRLYLAISPRLEIADERAVIDAILNALRESSPMADAARVVWQQAQTIQIRRQEPVWTGHKFPPLRTERRPD